jgi:MscS family membrane protein
MKKFYQWMAFVFLGMYASTSHAETMSQPTFGLDKSEVLQGHLGNYPLWQYAATVAWIVLAFVLAAVIDFVITRFLKRLTEKTETDIDDKLLEILHRPIKVVVVLGMLHAGMQAYEWPVWLERILGPAFIVGVAITVIYVAVKLVDLLLAYMEGKFFEGDTQLAQMMLPVLGKTFKVIVVILGFLTTAQVLGFPITSVLAGLGVGGVAVALAAQNTLANVFGSITILTDRPFRVGDRVQIEKYDGVVELIGLRSTRIRTVEGHLVSIPNKIVADSGITNISLRPNIRQLMTISLTYDTTPEKMREAVTMLREIFQRHPLTHDVWVYWKDYAASSLDIFVVYWCKGTDYKAFLQALEELNLEIKQRFDAAGLDFAFPTQTIHLANNDGRQ